jgi:ATP-dependent helicase/nuclease subunit B
MLLTKKNIKEIDIDFLIDEKIKNNKVDQLLVIVPTNRRLRRLKKEIISALPQYAGSEINIETLSTLSEKILGKVEAFQDLSESASTVLLKQSAKEIELKYFSNYKNEIPSGTLDRIKNVISEYKRQGITPAHLLEEAEKIGEKNNSNGEVLKAIDIAKVYERYREKCSELSALELGDIYLKLNELEQSKFAKFFRAKFPKVDLIVINGFDEFSYPEVKILDNLSKIEKKNEIIDLFIDFDYYEYNPLIFSHLDDCYEKLLKFNFRRIEDKSLRNFKGRNFISNVKENLFLKNFNSKVKDYSESIDIIKGNSREEEIELIAKEVKGLITEKKVEPYKICVSFNLINHYSHIVRDIFDKYGIAYNLTDRIPLDNAKPVTSIISFLEVLENNYYYKSLFKALSSGFVDVDVNLNNLFLVASELKIVVGKENWKRTISDWIKNIDLETEVTESEAQFRKRRYERALKDFEKITDLLSPFEKKLKVNEFLEELTRLVKRLKLHKNLLESPDGSQERNIKALTTLFETAKEVLELLDRQNPESKAKPVKYYLEQLRTACGWARFNVKERSDYGVLVTSVNEIRGLKFDYTFIGGLCDGDFPTKFSPEVFFSGSFAKEEYKHQTEERYHFYQALSTWQKGLYFSIPLYEKDKELVPSNFIKEFISVFATGEVTSEKYNKTIYTYEELQRKLGLHGIEYLKRNVEGIESYLNLDEIENAIKVDTLRMEEPFTESAYNGFLYGYDCSLTDEAEKTLKEFVEKEFSVSQLEVYALCPFKFFSERVLRLEVVEEPTEEIEALEIGKILHDILYEFFTKMREQGVVLLNCDESTFSHSVESIFKIAEDHIENSPFHSPLSFYDKEKILGINGNRRESILYKVLENERNNKSGDIPKYFEVAFGKIRKIGVDDKLSREEPVKIGDVKIRGKIDRIELNDENNSFNIVDYKLSGKKPTFQELWDGLSLQLPVYLEAARELLGNSYEPGKMNIYSLKYNDSDFGKREVRVSRSKNVNLSELNSELIKEVEKKVNQYKQGIEEGKFNLTQLDDAENKVCRYCSFQSICRVKEINT